MIKSLEANGLRKDFRPLLRDTCKGKWKTELKICIENVLLAFHSVVVDTSSYKIKKESVLHQYGLGKILNIYKLSKKIRRCFLVSF